MFAFFAAFFSSRRLDEAMACWGGRSLPARPASRMPAFFSAGGVDGGAAGGVAWLILLAFLARRRLKKIIELVT